MKIDCLMGTCGRYSLLCEALACFLQQRVDAEAGLLIYNQHPVPLKFDHPRVRVVNEEPPEGGMRHLRHRMLELADPAADLIHWWDDDDLYLPWHLTDCVANIGDNVAWKPETSWAWQSDQTFTRERNSFEGSWVFRASHVRAAPLDTHPTYTDHPVYRQTLEAGKLATTELGGGASYIYRWYTGTRHVSQFGGEMDEDSQGAILEELRSMSQDVRADGRLVPADLSPKWRQFLEGTRHLMTAREWEANRARLILE